MFAPRLGDPETRGISSHTFLLHLGWSETALDGGRCPYPMVVKRINAIEALIAAATEAAGAGQTPSIHGDISPLSLVA